MEGKNCGSRKTAAGMPDSEKRERVKCRIFLNQVNQMVEFDQRFREPDRRIPFRIVGSFSVKGDDAVAVSDKEFKYGQIIVRSGMKAMGEGDQSFGRLGRIVITGAGNVVGRK